MAIIATVKTPLGEDRELYIRLNNIEVSNHGELSTAKFRGFLSQDAYKAGANYAWEYDTEFMADVGQPLWAQAYQALKSSLNVAGDVFEDC